MIDVDEDRLTQERRANRDRRAKLCAELKNLLGNPRIREARDNGGGPMADVTDAKIEQLKRNIADCDAREAQLHDALLRAQSQ
jgi:hypothetical protein